MRILTAITLLLALAAPAAATQAGDGYEGEGYTYDVEGSKDHPLITRYEGSVINGYEHFEFNDYALPLGPFSHYEDGRYYLEETRPLEGETTFITFRGPAGRSTLEVFRNYERALADAGFEVLYECAARECGEDFAYAAYPADNAGNVKSSDWRTQRFLAAHHPSSGGDIYVTVFSTAGWDGPEIPFTRVEIVEVEAMETGKVAVNADAMKEALDATGKVALYNLYFDTGRSDLKPESAEALEQISLLMDRYGDLRLHVVGHTDATGSMDGNMRLSQARAESVVDALVDRHGIDRGRLSPHGVGPLAPVASNRSDDGKARNRRVELVVRID